MGIVSLEFQEQDANLSFLTPKSHNMLEFFSSSYPQFNSVYPEIAYLKLS